MRRLTPTALLLTAVLLAGCEYAIPFIPDGDDRVLELRVDGLEPLADGFHYEGWVIVDGAPVSTGKFNVAPNGWIVDLDGALVPGGRFAPDVDLGAATDVVLTIEPAGDVDDLPAATKLLGGALTGGQAVLTTAHPAALGSTFADAAGAYILATPTNGAETDENSGIWFIDLRGGTPAPGLDLPALPDGWRYEGWVVIDERPVTTGAFTDVAAADAAAPFSGTEAGPPFPGEDFLRNAPAGLSFPLDLAGRTVVVSVEPFPDDSPAPFALKPLVGAIPTGAADHATYLMEGNAAAFPTATARVH